MHLALALTLWVALSGAAHVYLRKTGRAAVPIMAGLTAAGLAGAGLVQLVTPPPSPETSHYTDTYYVVAKGHFLINMAISYLIVAALALVIWKLARGWPRHLLSPAFWLFHLGSGAVILPMFTARFQVLQNTANDPDAFRWLHMAATQGAQFSLFGAIGLLTLAVVALGQWAIKARAT